MTTLRIQSDNEWLDVAQPSFLTSDVKALQVTSRTGAQPLGQSASSGTCLILPFQATAPEERCSTTDDFAALAAEVETDADVKDARKWVAETFYPGDLTLGALRLSAGLSQAELGARAGMQQSHISRYESGKHEPGVQAARTLANALGVSLDKFVEAWEGSRRRIAAHTVE